ncbi:hypothetical protein [Kitasatospora sp. NPDC088548]|uniref:hypothetical protein n=1 Tax=Kitasatospora sp. NPDC088548 TaxID=3364075 RepID=UPI003806AAD6
MQTRLGELLFSSGETTESFIERYKATGKALFKETNNRDFQTLDLSVMTVSRWRNGGVKGLPRFPAPAVLERMFPRLTAKDLFAPAGGSSMPPAVGSVIDESDLVMNARRAAEHASDAAASNLPDMTIDQVEDDALALARAYHTHPPFAVYGMGNELLATVTAMLDRTQIVRQRERLYLAAGQASAVLATAVFDLGSITAATSFARTAAMYGEVVDHGPLRAFAHGTLGILAYWDQRPAEAIRQVEKAQSFPGLGDTARQRLAVIEARAYGHLGDANSARLAATAALEPGDGKRDGLHDDVGGEFSFSRRRALMSNATTFLLVKDGPAAEQSAMESIALMRKVHDSGLSTPQEATDLAQAAIDLSHARLLAGEFDGAVEAVAPVFEIPKEWRVAGITSRAGGLRRALASPEISGPGPVRVELAERIEEYVAVGAHSQLGGTLAIG